MRHVLYRVRYDLFPLTHHSPPPNAGIILCAKSSFMRWQLLHTSFYMTALAKSLVDVMLSLSLYHAKTGLSEACQAM